MTGPGATTYPCKCTNKTMNVLLWFLCIHRCTDVKHILKENKTVTKRDYCTLQGPFTQFLTINFRLTRFFFFAPSAATPICAYKAAVISLQFSGTFSTISPEGFKLATRRKTIVVYKTCLLVHIRQNIWPVYHESLKPFSYWTHLNLIESAAAWLQHECNKNSIRNYKKKTAKSPVWLGPSPLLPKSDL